MQHEWIKSTLGHGETMCARCFVTNREAAAIRMHECDVPPKPPVAANYNQQQIDDDMGPPFICPITDQPCLTEQDEFCEDYGCARKAGVI